ncbi:hypothetical protein HLI_02555 [Halobacillus litoralis]|uniref:Permease n=1 Tax=Halobacillus litoralis TaxID=45668 RepID=A0A410M8W1_9BACI|nr:hypothetical protein HLI_02555 [Halobacillus litoralis]
MRNRLRKISWKDALIGLTFIIVLYFTLPYFGINPFYIVSILMGILMGAVEWITKFILPWIVLYWGARLIKNLESRQVSK